MTIPLWPATLPKPERQTFQKTWTEGRLKRQSEAGPPGYRRRFSAVAIRVARETFIAVSKNVPQLKLIWHKNDKAQRLMVWSVEN